MTIYNRQAEDTPAAAAHEARLVKALKDAIADMDRRTSLELHRLLYQGEDSQ